MKYLFMPNHLFFSPIALKSSVEIIKLIVSPITVNARIPTIIIRVRSRPNLMLNFCFKPEKKDYQMKLFTNNPLSTYLKN